MAVVTIRQIAERAGVAPSTVSAALSPVCKKKVSESLGKEIRAIAKKMGYTANLSARSLRTNKTFLLGVVIPSFFGHHPISIYFDLIASECAEKGYRAVPLQVSREPKKMDASIKELSQHHVDGLLFLDYMRFAYEQYLKLWQIGSPMVFRILDPSLVAVPFDYVMFDHYKGVMLLLGHIVSQGWSKIIYVREAARASFSHLPANYRAFDDFRVESNPHIEKQIHEYPVRTAISRYEATLELIKSGRIVKGKTCLFFDGGDGCSGAYTALMENGFAIGKDVGFATLNSVPGNEFLVPVPTMINEPYKAIASELVNKLIQAVEDKGNNGNQQRTLAVIDPTLNISSATTAKNDAP